MSFPFRKKFISLVVCFSLVIPFPVYAVFDFGGWVLNTPGAPGSYMSAFAIPAPIYGVDSFVYPPCINGVAEVDILQAAGVPQPPILLQAIGYYTFSKGPARHPGQQVLGKYFPVMVCIANFWVWVDCGFSLCPVVIPLPFFLAPLIIFNGSSI